MLWMLKFNDDLVKFITMVSACTYYFNNSKDKVGGAEVMTGFRFAYFKHQGSLAFGSLIMTLVTILRAIVDSLANSARDSNDGAAKCIACIAQCLMGCLEDLIEYISRTAYAYMAISGDPFCQSAWNGFLLNLKYLAKFYFAVNIAGMFVLMGIVACTCANAGIAYLLMAYATNELQAVSSPLGPLICAAVVQFVVACIFLGLFDEAVLATLHCFAVDSDLHNGEPKFGPKSYHDKLESIHDWKQGVHVVQQAQDPEQQHLVTNQPPAGNNA